jgi:heat shock protein HslJ
MQLSCKETIRIMKTGILKKYLLPGLLVLVSLLVSACMPISPNGSPAAMPAVGGEAVTLIGAPWDLVEFKDAAGVMTPAVAPASIWLHDDQMLSGNGGCNNFAGGFILFGPDLTVIPGPSTMMACEPAEVMAQEAAMLANLSETASYMIAGGQLHILNAAGEITLIFEPQVAPALVGTLWQVTDYNNGNQAVVGVLEGTQMTILFGEDGSVSGSAGCNNFMTDFSVEGDQIAIGPAATTMMMCPEPAGVMEQEAAFVLALETAATYSIRNDVLEMRTADDAMVARFVPAAGEAAAEGGEMPALEGAPWQLVDFVAVDGAVMVAVAPASIQLQNGQLTGNSGCNNFSAGYTLDGAQLTALAGPSTLMACEPAEIMVQEAALLANLTQAAAYEIAGDQLHILNAAGEVVLTFVPQVGMLEGTQITILFGEDGSVSGSAGCNNFMTDFSVDGDQIAIGPAATTRMLCPEPAGVMEQEAAFVLALETAATFSIRDGVLEMRTADDAMVARFVPAAVEAAAAEGDSILDVTWQWVETAYGDDTVLTVSDPSQYLMTLQSDGAVVLQADCNRAGGTFQQDGAVIAFDVAIMTFMACPDGSLANQFVDELNAAATTVMDGEDLILNLFADAGNMRFTRGK